MGRQRGLQQVTSVTIGPHGQARVAFYDPGMQICPRCGEDDPERAVRCALGMLGAIEELNQEASLDLAVRIGITTGEALVRLDADRRTEGVVGDVVNTAGRLEAAAPTDGILVDQTTFRATDRAIDYRLTDPIQAKGKAAPVPVWLALHGKA